MQMKWGNKDIEDKIILKMKSVDFEEIMLTYYLREFIDFVRHYS